MVADRWQSRQSIEPDVGCGPFVVKQLVVFLTARANKKYVALVVGKRRFPAGNGRRITLGSEPRNARRGCHLVRLNACSVNLENIPIALGSPYAVHGLSLQRQDSEQNPGQ
jgi:hypothetical protein